METHRYDVVVIGGGPAGMMAAAAAAARGRRVALLEKNAKLGKKLDITGGGRCNITNAEFDARAFLSHYGQSGKFLASPLSQFGVQSTFDFFAARQVPLAVQARKRVFPASEQARDVTAALAGLLRERGVAIFTKTAVQGLRAEGGRIVEAAARGASFAADSFILATGGFSHPETGSTGEGFAWLSALGHRVHAPTPAIVPLKTSDAWVKNLAGVSLPEAKLVFFVEGKRAFARTGPLLFTHFGLSGPTVLNSAAEVDDLLQAGAVVCAIDIFPRLDFPATDEKILAALDAGKNKLLVNVLAGAVPRGIAKAVCDMLALAPDTKAHSFGKEDRRRLVHLLKAMPARIEGLMGFDRAVVADGGVALTEVDTRTFASRPFPNLYLVGDILHVSRPSGGFSLQLCWTSGYAAGSAA